MLMRMRGKGTLTHCWGERKLVQPPWKTVWRLLKKLKAGGRNEPSLVCTYE
jgi:hypothetical protein